MAPEWGDEPLLTKKPRKERIEEKRKEAERIAPKPPTPPKDEYL